MHCCGTTAPQARLQLTGERTLPGIAAENYWFRRHEAAYRFFAPRCAGAVVLEAGCGEGYGGQLLAESGARRVLALDCDRPTMTHVRRTYPDLTPVLGNLVALPCADAVVDIVVCSQVVEHLWDQPRFVRECARVLRPGGRLLLSTPDRRTFPPGNPFHSRELDPAELSELLREHLDVRGLVGIRHGPRLRAWEARHGDLVAAQSADAPDDWPAGLTRLVATVTAADFELVDAHEVGSHDAAVLDLIAVAERQ